MQCPPRSAPSRWWLRLCSGGSQAAFRRKPAGSQLWRDLQGELAGVLSGEQAGEHVGEQFDVARHGVLDASQPAVVGLLDANPARGRRRRMKVPKASRTFLEPDMVVDV